MYESKVFRKIVCTSCMGSGRVRHVNCPDCKSVGHFMSDAPWCVTPVSGRSMFLALIKGQEALSSSKLNRSLS